MTSVGTTRNPQIKSTGKTSSIQSMKLFIRPNHGDSKDPIDHQRPNPLMQNHGNPTLIINTCMINDLVCVSNNLYIDLYKCLFIPPINPWFSNHLRSTVPPQPASCGSYADAVAGGAAGGLPFRVRFHGGGGGRGGDDTTCTWLTW